VTGGEQAKNNWQSEQVDLDSCAIFLSFDTSTNWYFADFYSPAQSVEAVNIAVQDAELL
jgi:hypothetical protein